MNSKSGLDFYILVLFGNYAVIGGKIEFGKHK